MVERLVDELDRVGPRFGPVSSHVPGDFEAYVRIAHRVDMGQHWSRWRDLGVEMVPGVMFYETAVGSASRDQPYTGDLDELQRRRLIPILLRDDLSRQCICAVWTVMEASHMPWFRHSFTLSHPAGSYRVFTVPGSLLVDDPDERYFDDGSHYGHVIVPLTGPRWYIASHYEWDSTFVGADAATVQRIVDDPELEAVTVTPDTPA